MSSVHIDISKKSCRGCSEEGLSSNCTNYTNWFFALLRRRGCHRITRITLIGSSQGSEEVGHRIALIGSSLCSEDGLVIELHELDELALRLRSA